MAKAELESDSWHFIAYLIISCCFLLLYKVEPIKYVLSSSREKRRGEGRRRKREREKEKESPLVAVVEEK